MSRSGASASCAIQDSAPRRIVVLRALQLGDMLCAVPALRALRLAAPQARITLVGLSWARSFAAHLGHLVDDFVSLPGFPGLPEQPAHVDELPAFLGEVQDRRFDLALQLHGSGIITNPLALLLGARRTAGCYAPGQFCPDPATFIPYPDSIHEVRRPLRLLQALGIRAEDERLEFPIDAAAEQRLSLVRGEIGLASPYVCIHPGARNVARRWPAQQFAAAADALAAEGLAIVVTGSEAEKDLTRSVTRHMRTPAFDLGGRTDLGTMAALLHQAELVLTNNTGVCHLASAVDVPSVALFHHPSECARWAPLDAERHPVVCDISPGALTPVLRHARALLGARRQPLQPLQEPTCTLSAS